MRDIHAELRHETNNALKSFAVVFVVSAVLVAAGLWYLDIAAYQVVPMVVSISAVVSLGWMLMRAVLREWWMVCLVALGIVVGVVVL